MARLVTAGVKADDNNAVLVSKGDIANGETAILWIGGTRQGTPSWPAGFTQIAETPVGDSATDEDVYVAYKVITDAASEPTNYSVNMNMGSSIRSYVCGLAATSKGEYKGGYGAEVFQGGTGYPFPQGDSFDDDTDIVFFTTSGGSVLDGTVSGGTATVLESGTSDPSGASTLHTGYLIAEGQQATQGTTAALQADSAGGGNVSMITAIFGNAAGTGFTVEVPTATITNNTFAPVVTTGTGSAPVISNVSSLDADNTVTVTVDTYQAGAQVSLNGSPVATVEQSPTTLTFTAPRGGLGGLGASVAVTVVDGNGTSNTVNETFNAPTGWGFVTLTGVGAGSIAEANGSEIGDQMTFELLDSSTNTFLIDANGYAVFDDSSAGGAVAEFYSLDASDAFSAPLPPNSTVTKVLSIDVPTATQSITTFAPLVSTNTGSGFAVEVPSVTINTNTFAPEFVTTEGGPVLIDVPSQVVSITTHAPSVSLGVIMVRKERFVRL